QKIAFPSATGLAAVQLVSQVPQAGGPNRAVSVGVGLWARIEIVHRLAGDETASMYFVLIVAPMPGPNIRSLEHHGLPVVARSFVECRLAIILALRRLQRVAAEIRRVPGNVVSILVVDNPRVVRGIRPIAVSGSPDQSADGQQFPSGAQVNFSVW